MFKKIILIPSILVLVTMLLLPSIIFAYTSGPYISTLSFHGEHQGTARYYSGTSIFIELTTYSDTNPDFHSTTYDIYLYRKRAWLPDELIGIRYNNPRDGYTKRSWIISQPSDYYFTFVKTRDNISVKSDRVVMWSP